MLTRVISGGQVGADIAGLRAAKKLGIETGGYMPRGFRTKYGLRPEYKKEFGVQETGSSGYPLRTFANAREAGVTLRLAADFTTAGEQLTFRACQQAGRSCYSVRWYPETNTFSTTPEIVASYLRNHEIVNIAGNARTELEKPAERFLIEVFKILLEEGETVE